jgi:hypothetical protein
MSARAYLIALMAGIALVLGLTAGFNRVVDPFWYYRDIEIPGLNAIKTKVERFERHVKPQVLARERPEAIVLGSSLAEIGFDPRNAAFTDGGRLAGYNFAFAGTGWDRLPCYLEYALVHAPVRRVVIGIHPGALPRVDCAGKLPEIEEFSHAKLLLSRRALKASLDTVREQRRGRPSHTREGMYFYARGAPGVESRFREFFTARLYRGGSCDRAALAADPPRAVTLAPALPAAANVDLAGLERVLRLAADHGVELRLFAYPSHALSLELEAVCGGWDERWAALASIAALVERAPGNVQLWEFYGYNEWTGEPVVGGNPVYWQDPEHFNFEFGGFLLDAMFGGPGMPPGLGRRVMVAGLPQAYQQFVAGRSAWLAGHPQLLGELRTLTRVGDAGVR